MRRHIPILILLVLLLACGMAAGKTYNSPYIDGHVTEDENDWEPDELGVEDPDNDNRWGASDGDLVDLYVTWDADSLYVGITTVNGPGGYGNGYLLFIDTDAQNGITGATDFSSADFYARNVTFSTMGADVIMGGWNLPGVFDIKHCSDPASTTPVDEVYSQCNPGWKHIEARMSWNGLFGLGSGVVPDGTVLRFISAVVGGDGSGAYDAMPTSSTGVESNSSTPWDAFTDLDNYYETVVDADADGVPDEGFPPGGSISGTVTLDDPDDQTTVVTVTAWSGGAAVESADAPPGGGDYTIYLVPDGTYDVVATGESYLSETVEGVVIVDEAEIAGIDFALTKVTGRIEGQVALSGGPATDVTVTVYDAETGAVGGDGSYVVTGGSGSFSIATVIDGDWNVVAEAMGYVEAETPATVSDGDTVNVGMLTLPAVEATHFAYVDSLGSTIYGVATTVSIPDSGLYYYAAAWLEPRDDEDRVAHWDADFIDSVSMSATRLNPAHPPLGNVVIADTNGVALDPPAITGDMFVNGRAGFLVADDEVEILRVLATSERLVNVLEVGIGAPAPTELTLESDSYEIAVGDSVARITGQLVDASGNDAPVAGLSATMTALGVGGGFSMTVVETDPNGRFEVEFSGTVAGTALVTAVIDPSSEFASIDVDTLTIVLESGDAALVELAASPAALRAGETAVLTASVVDEWGNPVEHADLSIALAATPEELVVSIDTPIVTDTDGVAVGTIEVGTDYGIIEIVGDAGDLPVETVFLPIDATIIAVDEEAPETDDGHNSNAGVDLTILHATNGADTLVVTLDFSSNWDGAHLGLAIEANGDADGATPEPFTFPINYGHDLLPDYAFTYKYAAENYADLRKWNGRGWQFYDHINEIWVTEWVDGANVVGWIAKSADKVAFRIPLAVIGAAVGDTLRLEAYVMQETDGEQRTALDSVPHDATHDMEPETGEWWETATTPVTLTNYADYVVVSEGFAPGLANGQAGPSPAQPGDVVTYSIEVTDTGGGIGDVFLNLLDIGGEPLIRMQDGGEWPDIVGGDGVYTVADTLTSSASNGEHMMTVTARDATNVWPATTGITLTVDNPATALRQFTDAEGDDHGPNQTDSNGNPVGGLYYYYPTNMVFFPGSFDIASFEIFADGDWLVFRTYIAELINHQDPGAADWGAPQPSQQTCDDPYRTDLNLQKIDIYIDAKEGAGATSGFPNRYVDVASVDAWDYGVSIEGWGKWFVISNDSNSSASWSLHKNDSDIAMCDNYEEDFIDVRVQRGLFGDDADEDADIGNWDIIVCISSHDGESSDSNLGGIRWINNNTGEWHFGGGRDSEGGRDRDANLIDVAVSPGEGKAPGRTQEEMLDYTTADAEQRFDESKVACVLEASFAEDFSPPIITEFESHRPDDHIPVEGEETIEHIPWLALDGAPAVFWTTITDPVSGVESARFFWHTLGDTTRHAVDMVALTEDVWAADVARAEIVAVTSEIDLNVTGMGRVIVGYIHATDKSSNENDIWAGPFELAIPEPWAESQRITCVDSLRATEEPGFIFQDGTIVSVDEASLPTDVRDDLAFVLTPMDASLADLSNIRDDMEFMGTARTVTLETLDGVEMELEGPATVKLHYPEYDAGSLDERKFGFFKWVTETERWVLKGAANSPSSNTVGAVTDVLGLFGIFFWNGLDFDDTAGLSGVISEPNPFSPNGDGIYDSTTITFYLGREADHVNVEFYDLSGRLARRLVWHQPTEFTGWLQGSIDWDGTDENGHVVPYGIYVMRVEAKFKTEPTYERVNRPVVVIK
jgi:hypothetical protein